MQFGEGEGSLVGGLLLDPGVAADGLGRHGAQHGRDRLCWERSELLDFEYMHVGRKIRLALRQDLLKVESDLAGAEDDLLLVSRSFRFV